MNNNYYIYIIIVLFVFILIALNSKLNFDGVTDISGLDKNAIFVNLFDNNGNKLNVTLISKPFGGANDFKQFLVNKPNKIYLGITSYMEFPYIPSNPLDNYIDIKQKIEGDGKNEHYFDMYLDICDGWLHCFKNPKEYLPIDKPSALISESDFVNYNIVKPDPSIIKEYDFIYSCPKVNESSGCDDWVAYNKNWELAKKCIKVLSEDMRLKGLLIGRKDCDIPKNCDATGWVNYLDMLKMYNKAKFILIPNQADASPRVLTECLATNLACLVNENILGGWKYVNDKTGEFFTDEKNIRTSAERLMSKLDSYQPRQYIIDNYGPINAGKVLKKFLYENFKNKINIPEENVEYVTMRGKLNNFVP
jgi:hypothetical protein